MIEPIVHWFESVGSTNDVALKMALDGAPEGTVVLADQQTTGRGRRGRVWLDEPGMSVLSSTILRPQVAPSDVPKLSFVVSMGVAACLKAACYVESALKWPNDVMLKGRKLAGILVESARTPQGPAVIAGVGINVNQAVFDPEIAEIATSLRLETGSVYSVRALGESLAAHILAQYERFLTDGFEDILADWRKYMWGVGETVEVATESVTLCGVIQGVDSEGALLLTDSLGATHAIHAADTIKTTRN